jgi:glycosyltransferase involved in cell wall biosynthesis
MNPIADTFILKRTNKIVLTGSKFLAPIKLRRFLKEKKIDVIMNLSGSSEVALATGFATLFLKTKNIFCFNGYPKFYLNWIFPFSQFFTYRFIAVSREGERLLKKYLFPSRHKTVYLPYPINVQLFRPKNKELLRKKLGFNKEDKIIIHVGRVEYAQGSDYLLKIIQKNPDKKFIVIGKVKDQYMEQNTFKNVRMISYLPHEQISDYYALADLSLFLTRRNSYPFPPRESLACGIPVVVFNIGAFNVMNTSAVIRSPFNAHLLNDRIQDFFRLPKDAIEKISREGRDFIMRDSSEEAIQEKTLQYLDIHTDTKVQCIAQRHMS